MKFEEVATGNKAILAAAVAALLVGCGGSSGNGDPETANQLTFDDGLSAQGADVSTVAALEGSAEALVEDGNAIAEFIANLNEEIGSVNRPDLGGGEIATFGLAERSHGPLDLAVFSPQTHRDRRTRLAARGDQTVVTLSAQELPEGESTNTLRCPEGGHLRSDLAREIDVEGDTRILSETLLQTFEGCTVALGNELLELNGTWKTEIEERDTVETLDNDSAKGEWTDTFATTIDLRGSRSGTDDALVMDGALTGEESGDWSESGDAVNGSGMLIVNVERMEARLETHAGTPVYVGQLEGSLIEEFTFSGSSSETLNETGETQISGKLVSSGMAGALSIRTEKSVRYEGSAEDLQQACPSEGVVVLSGARGDAVEVAFGVDTGNTGQEVSVEVAGDFKLYPTCAEADYLGPVFFGPFSQITEGAATD